jgi:DNA-binding NarL/FixJ family response regulator
MKFLVLDDHELIREAMRAALAQMESEAEIFEASDGAEGIRMVEQHPDLDLIMLDLNLPDRDGFSLLAELRRNHPGISVVVMSGQQDQDSVVKALNMGALGFIPKSVPRRVILGALQLVMSGGTYIPPQGLATGQLQAATSTALPSASKASAAPPPGGDTKVSPADLGLTPRQCDVLALVMQGKPNKAICRDLDLSEATVKTHVSAIMRALDVSNRVEIVVAVSALKLDLPPSSKT